MREEEIRCSSFRRKGEKKISFSTYAAFRRQEKKGISGNKESKLLCSFPKRIDRYYQTHGMRNESHVRLKWLRRRLVQLCKVPEKCVLL
jgi:hypothetical protein